MRFWEDPANQRAFMERLAKAKDYKTFQDWYSCSLHDIEKLGGSGLWNIYGNSPSRIVMAIYNKHNWEPWLFKVTPVGFWNDIQNRHTYMEWLGGVLKFSKHEDWYETRREHFVKNGGSALIATYNYSIPKLVTSLLPNHPWQVWRFRSLPLTYWLDKNNQREYVRWLGDFLGFKNYEDWYSATSSDFINNFGNTLLKKYKGSPGFLLMNVLSEHQWDTWRFSRKRNFGMPDDASILQRFVAQLTKELNLDKLTDWYNVSSQAMQDLGISGSFFKRNGDLPGMLAVVYPQHTWEKEKFSRSLSKKAMQRLLEATVSKIYVDEEMKIDHFYQELTCDKGKPLQLDLFIPSHRIAFEFQGIQHYDTSLFAGKVLPDGTAKERSKKEVCESAGITLVEVPYWWDKRVDSLLKIIDHCKNGK